MGIEKHKNQLKQLKKLDKITYDKATALIENGYPNLTIDVITKTMEAALIRHNDPIDQAWRAVKNTIERQEIRIVIPNATQVLYDKDGLKIVLRRDRFDRLRIFALKNGAPLRGNSIEIGFFGRDENHISSAYAGKWKLRDGAEGKVKRYLDPTPVAPKKYGEYKMR